MSRKATPGYAALADGNARLAKAFDDLSQGYDLLHKRIEAYDETHAYLQELRKANESLLEVWRGVKHVEPHAQPMDDAIDALRAVLAKLAERDLEKRKQDALAVAALAQGWTEPKEA